MPDRDGIEPLELPAHGRWIEDCRHALAPRGRAQPCEVDHIGLLGELTRAVDRRTRLISEHQRNLPTKVAAPLGIHQRSEVAAAARHEHRDSRRHGPVSA